MSNSRAEKQGTSQLTESDVALFSQSYPLALQGRYSERCLAYRADHERLSRELLQSYRHHWPSAHDYVGRQLLSPNLLLPRDANRFSSLFDFIGCILVGSKKGEDSAFIIVENPSFGKPSGSFGHRERGVGKTKLALTLLGIGDFLDQLPPIETRGTISPNDFTPFMLQPENPSLFRLVSLDFSHAGHINNRFVAAPVLGALSETQWDIARSATRAKVARVRENYDRRHPIVRAYQTLCAENLGIDIQLFVSEDTLVPMSRMVIINLIPDPHAAVIQKTIFQNQERTLTQIMQVTETAWVALEIVPENQAHIVSRTMFEVNPLYHGYPFWDIDEKHHRKVIGDIKDYQLPVNVAFLYVYPGENVLTPNETQQLFETEALLVRKWITDGGN